jgi:tetratricopeptide (TPR) repeat protein
MANEQVQKLLQGAVKAAKAGNPELARKAFLQAIKLDKTSEAAWLGLASVTSDKKEQLQALKQVLMMNPDNTRARAAVEKMGIAPERLIGQQPAPPTPEPAPPPDPTPPPAPPADDLPDYLRDMALPDEDADETGEADIDTPDDDFADEASDDVGDIDDVPVDTPVVDTPVEEEIVLEPIDWDALFARIPTQVRGDGGVPVPDRQSLQSVAETAETQVEAYLEAMYKTGNFEWEEKKRGRAGERELTILRLQVGAVVGVIFIIAGLVIASILTQQAEERRVALLDPTWTVSPTPTTTPTSTPGTTPTPSPTPALSATPSPTIDPSITPGSIFATAEPTDFYVPIGVGREADVEEAARLIEQGNLDDALPLLESARAGTATTGNFLPYYYLSIWHLERNDPISARDVIEAGETAWQERSPNTNYGPLVDVAYARVLLEEARRLRADGANADAIENRLEEIRTRTENTIQSDGRFTEAYLLLAESYRIADEDEEALRVLTEAKNNTVIENSFVDLRIRTRIAEIFVAREDYDLALQELYEVLFIDPYNENALNLQAEVALAQDEAGLAVIFAEQYLARYPDSARAFTLRGLAWASEGKYDLALNQYDRALLSENINESQETDILLARADVYNTLSQYEEALADLSEALLIRDDDAIRVSRMQTAYRAGRYPTARDDADTLISANVNESIISAGELRLLQGRIALDTADEDDTNAIENALTDINQAIFVEGVPEVLRPVADEYLARANFLLGNYEDARNAIELALNAGETGSRYYLRGQILEALGEQEDQAILLEQALRDYETVLAWNAVYNYPFREDLRIAHENLRDALAEISAEEDDT